MEQTTLIILQKSDSPLALGLEAALAHLSATKIYHPHPDPLPPVAYTSGALVVWDLWGFSETERAARADELSPEELGVVLGCAEVDQVCRHFLELTGALGLFTRGQVPWAVAATLEIALATHRRICTLRAQRARLQQELADRLIIEQAKSLLMLAKGYSEAEAMRRLQRYSRRTNQKMVNVARKLLAGYEIFNDKNHRRK